MENLVKELQAISIDNVRIDVVHLVNANTIEISCFSKDQMDFDAIVKIFKPIAKKAGLILALNGDVEQVNLPSSFLIDLAICHPQHDFIKAFYYTELRSESDIVLSDIQNLIDTKFVDSESQSIELDSCYDNNAQIRYELARLAKDALELALNCADDRLEDQVGNLVSSMANIESLANQL